MSFQMVLYHSSKAYRGGRTRYVIQNVWINSESRLLIRCITDNRRSGRKVASQSRLAETGKHQRIHYHNIWHYSIFNCRHAPADLAVLSVPRLATWCQWLPFKSSDIMSAVLCCLCLCMARALARVVPSDPPLAVGPSCIPIIVRMYH